MDNETKIDWRIGCFTVGELREALQYLPDDALIANSHGIVAEGVKVPEGSEFSEGVRLVPWFR
jgi:hypothetical protein